MMKVSNRYKSVEVMTHDASEEGVQVNKGVCNTGYPTTVLKFGVFTFFICCCLFVFKHVT